MVLYFILQGTRRAACVKKYDGDFEVVVLDFFCSFSLVHAGRIL